MVYYLRLLQLGWILARHGLLSLFVPFGFPLILVKIARPLRKLGLPESQGARLRLAFSAMGPTFLKLGQVLSTRADLVGAEMAHELAFLQDRVPPFAFSLAKATIEESFAKPVAALFQTLEETPVAAASIAQVHAAITTGGEKVAVKVLRPGIREAFARDIALFEWLAEWVMRKQPKMQRLRPKEVVRTLSNAIKKELDLRMEAASATTLLKNVREEDGCVIPKVDWQRTSDKVLTLEWVDGIPISDIEGLKAAGHDLNTVLVRASNTFFCQVFRDGFFHADMHPGNIFVGSSSEIILVDFGIIGRMDWPNRMFMAEIFKGFVEHDYATVARAHFDAGYVPQNQSQAEFALACMAIGKPTLDRPLNEVSIGKLLEQLFSVTEQFQMETQPQLLLFQKNLVLVEGLGRMLNPNINMWEMIRPQMESWATEHFSPKMKLKMLAKEKAAFMRQVPALIHKMEHIISEYDSKGLKLHPDTVQAYQQQQTSQHNDDRLILALLVIAAGIGFFLVAA